MDPDQQNILIKKFGGYWVGYIPTKACRFLKYFSSELQFVAFQKI